MANIRVIEIGCRWDIESANRVCFSGDLELLKTIDGQVVWNEMSCYNVALGGHLEVLKWLRERGFLGFTDLRCGSRGTL